MASAVENLNIDWKCLHTWQVASYNTMWCLIGCSIGDIGTIAFFDFSSDNEASLTISSKSPCN